MTHQVVPLRIYLTVFFALIAGTILTVAVTFVNLGQLNLIIALLIAITKASLVVLYFMHVKQSSPLTKVFVVSGLFWFGILLVLCFSDYWSRGWLPGSGQGWSDYSQQYGVREGSRALESTHGSSAGTGHGAQAPHEKEQR